MGRAMADNPYILGWLTGPGGASVDEAVQLARSSTLDFNRMGKYISVPNQIIAFLNAGLEGIDKAGRTIIAGAKDPEKLGWRLLARAVIYGFIPMFGLLAWNRRNKNYKEINHTEKIDNWIVMNDEESAEYWKIPKGHITKLIVNPAQMIAEKSTGQMVTDASNIAWSIYETTTPLPGVSDIPPALKLFLEPIANYNYYWNQTIEKPAQKALPPGHRFNKSTSESLKKIGQALNISPVMMQHQINTVFGGSGKNALFVIDLVTGQIDPKNIDVERLPIIKRFKGQSEEWKSEIEERLRDVNKRLSEMSKLNTASMAKYYGYKPEERQKAVRAMTVERTKLVTKRTELLAARSAITGFLAEAK
jgi:hypothetical protein